MQKQAVAKTNIVNTMNGSSIRCFDSSKLTPIGSRFMIAMSLLICLASLTKMPLCVGDCGGGTLCRISPLFVTVELAIGNNFSLALAVV